MDTAVTGPDELPSRSFIRRPFFQTRTSFDPGLKVRNHGFDDAVTGVVPDELTVVMTASLATMRFLR